jgi:nicotinate phosphoribosyltransferase
VDSALLRLDVDGIRRGRYADPPYVNIVGILATLAQSGYRMQVKPAEVGEALANAADVDVGNIVVETHWMVRRSPFAITAAMPKALAILRHCAGYYDSAGRFVSTAGSLEVEALDDGELVEYRGDPLEATPVLVVRGRYRDFALLKTPILGTLSRGSRVATNAYRTLRAARGKPVYFFSARYDPPEVQAADGYAYHVAVRRFNDDGLGTLRDPVSTLANTEWWGGDVEGTVSHEGVACFLGDPAELMIRFAEALPRDRIRVALVDFNNDCVTDTRRVMRALFARYRDCCESGAMDDADRYRLDGVRVDTSRELLDRSLVNGADPTDFGPSPRLIRLLRQAIDEEWRNWGLPARMHALAQRWCRRVKVMVSGGFDERTIGEFESQRVPVDFYGVGSAMLCNSSSDGTVTDFSSVVMRVRVGDAWYDIPKHGRGPNRDARLRRIEL